MPDDYAKKLLWDARKAAQKIVRFAEGRDFKAYCEDEMLSAAIERQFEIIGEAFTVLRRKDPATAARLPELPRAIAFRNILIHGYAVIDNDRVWTAVQNDLPSLVERLNALLAE